MAIFGSTGPLGGVKGGMGGSGGVPGTKNCNLFWEPHLGYKLGNFGLYELKTLYFAGFWSKNGHSGNKKWPFGAEVGVNLSAFFSKTTSLN